MVSVFLIPKLNDKATMMGYRNKSLHHKYVYNKIKYFLLMILEICQYNKFFMIKNTYLIRCSGKTDSWGLVN